MDRTQYVTVIHEHNHPTRLVVCAYHGSTIRLTKLDTYAPHYEEARAEAQALYPDRTVFVPRLGELPKPSTLKVVK